MPPPEDELRAETIRAVMALGGELGRLSGRDHAREVKRQIQTLYERAVNAMGLPWADGEIGPLIEEARKVIVRTFGTSAWDEPETVEQAKARMGMLPRGIDPPHPAEDAALPTVTDRELVDLRDYFDRLSGLEPIREPTSLHVRSALAELQRLRSRVAKLDRRSR